MPTCVSDALVGTNIPVRVNNIGGNKVLVSNTELNAGQPCTYVLLTPAELSQMQTAIESASGSSGAGGAGTCTSPFSLSAEDGGLLSAAIVGCWAAAYFVRSVINVVSNGVES